MRPLVKTCIQNMYTDYLFSIEVDKKCICKCQPANEETWAKSNKRYSVSTSLNIYIEKCLTCSYSEGLYVLDLKVILCTFVLKIFCMLPYLIEPLIEHYLVNYILSNCSILQCIRVE
ncbi:hypothetical protein E1301_Tti005841 [Triplophysa tibetana]|uniref:Uncharacterized protein n=1 Tax=Triplophysa tibetana TaxID=1572043 RepID=A0A5A9PYE2_9TELE|nr:hypothetical protein E1301_Tti005841 [Triplophysa tibetana]